MCGVCVWSSAYLATFESRPFPPTHPVHKQQECNAHRVTHTHTPHITQATRWGTNSGPVPNKDDTREQQQAFSTQTTIHHQPGSKPPGLQAAATRSSQQPSRHQPTNEQPAGAKAAAGVQCTHSHTHPSHHTSNPYGSWPGSLSEASR